MEFIISVNLRWIIRQDMLAGTRPRGAKCCPLVIASSKITASVCSMQTFTGVKLASSNRGVSFPLTACKTFGGEAGPFMQTPSATYLELKQLWGLKYITVSICSDATPLFPSKRHLWRCCFVCVSLHRFQGKCSVLCCLGNDKEGSEGKGVYVWHLQQSVNTHTSEM